MDIYDTIIKKIYANQASYTLELTLEEQPYITSPDSVQIGTEFMLTSEKTYLPEVEIDAYYWMFPDGTFVNAEELKYTFETPGEYQVTLGIVGTKFGEPFKDCSYKTIVATSDPVTSQASSIAKSMGSFEQEGQFTQSERPIDSNESATIVHSIEIATSTTQLADNHSIFSTLNDLFTVNTSFEPFDSLYIYSIGEWLNLADAYETWKQLISAGFEDAKIYSREKDSLNNLPLNASFSLENIQFDNNSWDIREDAKSTLNTLVLLLNEYPDLKLTITAHTDDVGSDSDNLELSKRRAESIKKHLNERGIDASRLQSKGVGEAEPKYSNETPEGREGNRRVEFKLLTLEHVEQSPNKP